jgi:hypothetical protein
VFGKEDATAAVKHLRERAAEVAAAG